MSCTSNNYFTLMLLHLNNNFTDSSLNNHTFELINNYDDFNAIAPTLIPPANTELLLKYFTLNPLSYSQVSLKPHIEGSPSDDLIVQYSPFSTALLDDDFTLEFRFFNSYIEQSYWNDLYEVFKIVHSTRPDETSIFDSLIDPIIWYSELGFDETVGGVTYEGSRDPYYTLQLSVINDSTLYTNPDPQQTLQYDDYNNMYNNIPTVSDIHSGYNHIISYWFEFHKYQHPLINGAYNHIALVKEGRVVSVYLNGNRVYQVTLLNGYNFNLNHFEALSGPGQGIVTLAPGDKTCELIVNVRQENSDGPMITEAMEEWRLSRTALYSGPSFVPPASKFLT